MWSIEKGYSSKKLPNSKNTFGREIDVFVKSIGKTHKEYLVNFDYMDKIMKEYGFEKIEVKSFSDYFDDMKNNGNNKKKIANSMSDSEKEFSFLNSAFIYRKVENTPDSMRATLVKMMKKQETKEFKKQNSDEVKETMDKLDVEEVTESTEELIENEEAKDEVDNDLDTDAESDLDIKIDE